MNTNHLFKLRVIRKLAFYRFGMVLVISCFCLSVESATVTALNGSGASLFTNPLSGSTATTDRTVENALANVVNGVDGVENTSTRGRIYDNGGATTGYMNFAPASSFTAGTVITAQSLQGIGWDGPNPWTLSLDGGAPVTSGAGAVTTHEWAVQQLDGGTYNEARINGTMASFNGSTRTYFAFQELLILPDRLNLLDTTATLNTGSGTIGNVEDLNGETHWQGATNDSIRLTLDGTRRVRTVVMANLFYDTSFNILNDQGLAMAGVTMTSAGAGATSEFIAINFATPVTTDYLDFNFTSGAPSIHIREIMALELLPIPEPGSLVLLLIGIATLLYLRRVIGKGCQGSGVGFQG